MRQDKYKTFQELADHEQGHYCIEVRPASSSTLILAPHGGGIEPGTSELAWAVAGGEYSLYIFEGIKPTGNGDLHITSSRFDEPQCLSMLQCAERVVTLHGEDRDEEVVFVGGLDEAAIARFEACLSAAGFHVLPPDRPHLHGRDPMNVCNRGRAGSGVQLEITNGLRRRFFTSLSSRIGRQHRTMTFSDFVSAVRKAASALSSGAAEVM